MTHVQAPLFAFEHEAPRDNEGLVLTTTYTFIGRSPTYDGVWELRNPYTGALVESGSVHVPLATGWQFVEGAQLVAHMALVLRHLNPF